MIDKLIRWQPIETAPKDKSTVLITDGKQIHSAFFYNGNWITCPFSSDCDSNCWDPQDTYPHRVSELTHWMRLPSLPNEIDRMNTLPGDDIKK